ncbi:hypothetical protein A9W99_01815 [Mycobacterium sp. 1164966.3]|uniref:hypothetical protein n=1 Tax=Mycobacterium sp. 1164966.3 TaxID=1856861 RepID=UPI000800006C|nr:hypothetical protein [Mycobacterium sp. 1164966.3]OBA82457.1 hypothetical protein A9W99_01815 [Mycobacterium sp. 1164966.3]
MFGLLRKWSQLGSLPAELREQLEAEGVIYLSGRVGVNRHFSGHVPGVYSASGVARYRGAFAFSTARIVATFPTSADPAMRCVDCGWDSRTGPARAAITDKGLSIKIDLPAVDRAFSGTMELNYKKHIDDNVLRQLPVKELAFPLDPVFVYRAAGVRLPK